MKDFTTPNWFFAKVASTIEDESCDGTFTETIILVDAVVRCHENLLGMAKKGHKADETKSSRKDLRGAKGSGKKRKATGGDLHDSPLRIISTERMTASDLENDELLDWREFMDEEMSEESTETPRIINSAEFVVDSEADVVDDDDDEVEESITRMDID